jgi:hypothetical protein
VAARERRQRVMDLRWLKAITLIKKLKLIEGNFGIRVYLNWGF